MVNYLQMVLQTGRTRTFIFHKFCLYCRFLFVFLCLVLSIFATLPLFEVYTGKALFYMVRLIPQRMFVNVMHIVLFIGMQPLYFLCLLCPPFLWIAQHQPIMDSLPVFCPHIFGVVLVNDVTSVLLLVDFWWYSCVFCWVFFLQFVSFKKCQALFYTTWWVNLLFTLFVSAWTLHPCGTSDDSNIREGF